MIRHAAEEAEEHRLAAAPKQIRNMSKLFPLGSEVSVRPDGLNHDQTLYVVGYAMPSSVYLSDIDPAVNRRNALKRRKAYPISAFVPIDHGKGKSEIIMPGEE